MHRIARMLRPALVLALVALVAPPLTAMPFAAATVCETFAHALPPGAGAASFTHLVPLPDDLAAQGCYFSRRTLTVSGRLEIEREELSGTGYYVRVRLSAGGAVPACGTLTVTLEAEPTPSPTPIPDAPTALHVEGSPARPELTWNGQGTGAALSLFDRSWGETLWERVVTGGTRVAVRDARLLLHHRYLFAVRECNADGHYSLETQGAFVLAARLEPCGPCAGRGSVPCPACGGSGHAAGGGVCLPCNGLGRVACKPCAGSGKVTVAELRPDSLPLPGEPGAPAPAPF